MTEKELMLSGQLYIAKDKELAEEYGIAANIVPQS